MAQISRTTVLDDRHMELSRKHDNGPGRQQCHCEPETPIGCLIKDFRNLWFCGHLIEQIGRAIKQPPRDKNACRKKRHQFDGRFHCDGYHQTILMLGRVNLPCSKNNGKKRKHQGHQQRNIAKHRRYRQFGSDAAQWHSRVGREEHFKRG